MGRWDRDAARGWVPNASTRRDPYRCEWGAVVGDRIRRLRRARSLTLKDLRERIYKPNGGRYSLGYLSRLERGWTNAPLYVYLTIAEILAADAGQLLGPDVALREASDGELAVIAVMRRVGLRPHEAILRLLAPGAGASMGELEEVREWAEKGAAKAEPELYGAPLRARPIDDWLTVVQRGHEDHGR